VKQCQCMRPEARFEGFVFVDLGGNVVLGNRIQEYLQCFAQVLWHFYSNPTKNSQVLSNHGVLTMDLQNRKTILEHTGWNLFQAGFVYQGG